MDKKCFIFFAETMHPLKLCHHFYHILKKFLNLAVNVTYIKTKEIKDNFVGTFPS